MRNVFHLSWLESSDVGLTFRWKKATAKKKKTAKNETFERYILGDSWASMWSLDKMKLSFCLLTELAIYRPMSSK